MQKKYRYRLDRRGRRITAVVTTLLVTAFVAFHFVWGANYLSCSIFCRSRATYR